MQPVWPHEMLQPLRSHSAWQNSEWWSSLSWSSENQGLSSESCSPGLQTHFFLDVMHWFVRCEGAEHLSKVIRNLPKNCSKNIYHMSGSHQSGLHDDILHLLGVDWDVGIRKRPGGGDVYISTNQEELKHVVVKLGLTLAGFIGPWLDNNCLGLLGQAQIIAQQLQKQHGTEG